MKTLPIDRKKIPRSVFRFAQQVRAAGHELFLVGGTVRDLLLHPATVTAAGDLDFATSARPQELQGLFARTIPTGIQHGTLTVLFEGLTLEVTTYRADGAYTDGRHPDSVRFSDSIEEDLQRRDFTINAMALNLETMEVLDPFGGRTDLQNRVLRAVGDPLQRFREDGLRPLRACRFAGKLEFTIEENTFQAISPCLDVFRKVAVERVRDELFKIMEARCPSLALEAMRESGLLAEVLPELLEGFGVEQNDYHKYDVYYHNLYACDAAPADQPLVRFAALLHDIGKVQASRSAQRREPEAETPVFYNHELVGARQADRILRRLKFSNADREQITHLIKHHMFHYTSEWTDGAVRRLMRNVGLENLPALFALRRADRIGNGKKQGPARSLDRLRSRIERIIEAENAITVRDLNINGHDLMETFHLQPGRLIGDILDYLLEAILDDPEKNEPAVLKEMAQEYLRKIEHDSRAG